MSHLTQIYGGDFAKFFGLLRIYELYINGAELTKIGHNSRKQTAWKCVGKKSCFGFSFQNFYLKCLKIIQLLKWKSRIATVPFANMPWIHCTSSWKTKTPKMKSKMPWKQFAGKITSLSICWLLFLKTWIDFDL